VLEQLIYKWRHSRRVIAEALYEAYEKLFNAGRLVTRREIERDVTRMFSGNFREWVGLSASENEKPDDYQTGEINAAQVS